MTSAICHSRHDLEEVARAVCDVPDAELPLRVELKRYRGKAQTRYLRRLNAQMRDIARWQYGQFTVPERVFDNVVEKTKHMRVDGKHIWPRYSEPDPDPYTGEVVYGPKSRADLNDDECKGICQWLDDFMITRSIPSNAPADNWQIPEAAA